MNKASHQIIHDTNNKPAFAVIPFEEYEKFMSLLAEKLDLKSPLLSEDGLSIRLPYGGPGAHIDLVRLADFCQRRSLVAIAISARQQRLSKFNPDQLGALEPMIRMCFLKLDSPYRNTMQATTEVVDALVQTGLFTRSKRDFNNAKEGQQFYRPVLALEVNQQAVSDFLIAHPLKKSTERIDLDYWRYRRYNGGLFGSED